MDEEGFVMPQGSGTWVFLGTFCATLLFRTGATTAPVALDLIFATIIGGLALALAKLVSHVIRDYLLDILIAPSGEAPVAVSSGATQTNTLHKRGDVQSTGAKTGPPNDGNFMNGDFLSVGKKQVKISIAEHGALMDSIDATFMSGENRVSISNRDLKLKLKALGLIENDRWTADALKLFKINLPEPDLVDDRPYEDYDFIPGLDGELEWDAAP